MGSQILPVSLPSSSSSSSELASASSQSQMLLHGSDDRSTSRLLLAPSPSLENQTSPEISPFLPRSSGYGSDGAGAGNQKRRRRVANEPMISSASGSDADGRHQSFRQDVRRAVTDTFLITRLIFKLLRFLGVGYKWIMRFLALGCYSALLFPGFVQVGYHYFFSSHIRRGIAYGDHPRSRLDLYLPKNTDGLKPVVAFVTGGAWIIGYKAWGTLLGQQLSESNIIVACIDYRNFPQGTIRDMVNDASDGISFICKNIADFGGDPNRIYLMGQSAGAHIGACTLLQQAIKEASEGDSISWSVSQIKGYFGLSGGYNLFNLVDHFHSRGLYRSLFLSIMDGEESLRQYSPEVMVQDPSIQAAVSLLPPIILFHGTGDYSIPSDASKDFAETLNEVGVKAQAILYEGKTHTDLFLQDPMRGGRDEMLKDLVAAIHADDSEATANNLVMPPFRRLVPEFMLKLARSVSPF